jgi:hypothetical protein
MEAVLLVAVLALSVAIAVGAAFGTLTLAMYLVDVAADWTKAPGRRRVAPTAAWTDAERTAATERPIAA